MDSLDAAAFLQIWKHFDRDDVGSIDGEQLESFFHFALQKNNMKKEDVSEEKLRRLRERLTSVSSAAGRLSFRELATMMLPEDENFLLFFRTETPLDNSVEFMRIWRNYDSDGSGFISAAELQGFLQDLFLQHGRNVSPEKLEGYTVTMMKIFDRNGDGRLDLNDLARILSLKENFLLKFRTDSKTGELEGPEVDGFVKDMMELVKPSISGTDLDKFRKALMSHCDVNGDGKIQKNELALCLGLKLS
ncbi:secretagogin-like isoform X2 [Salarias fasciatus]|uniref:secretagogin-like isoform X2 n=1 Tax=Salarias fasciatus TaxID=181472 RepID=UPI0011766DD3|nr:secretagogin-like isoform X2 [Salarias fasciatus]